MSVWYSVCGLVELRDCPESRAAVESLDAISTEIEVSASEGKEGKFDVEFSGGMICSYTTAEHFENLLAALSPFAIKPVKIRAECDNEPGYIWVGDPEKVIEAQREERLKKIKAMVKKLSDTDRLVLATFISSEQADALERATFLLHKLLTGDHKAMENVEDAILSAVAVLDASGRNDEWMEEYKDS